MTSSTVQCASPDWGGRDVKGCRDGLCNVTACQKPGATWFNSSTRKYYCRSCAHDINYWSQRDDGVTICTEGQGEPDFPILRSTLPAHHKDKDE